MFDEVVQREGTRRTVRRAAWLNASVVLHAGLVLALASIAFATPSSRDTVIQVTFVKGTAVPEKRLVPPAPARAAPPPPRRAPPREPARAAPRPVTAMVQPSEVPAELPPPGPPEPPEPAAPSGAGPDEGVVGGVPGAAPAGPSLPVGPLPFDERTMTHPVFASGPSPEYTRKALQRGVEGLMVVRCLVTAEGAVRDCRVLQGLPYMDEAVVEALQRRRYRPATARGVPVDVSYVFRIHLQLPP